MSVFCPNCRHGIKLKVPRPGRYTPKCPKCDKVFALVVPPDSAARPVAVAIPFAAVAHPAQPAISEISIVPEPPSVAPTGEADFSVGPAGARDSRHGLESSSGLDKTVALGDAVSPSSSRLTSGGAADTSYSRVNKSKGSADIPRTIGGYQVIGPLGQGGMGTVFLARQISLDRLVALKVMNPAVASNPTFVARFTREAFAAAQLTHHNVVQIYDIGAERGLHYFSMEYVQGQSLGQMLKDRGKLDPEEAVGYVLQAARGLKFAHDQGMVHRDVKPDNLMVNDQGIVKVADLGLVKAPVASEMAQDKSANAAPLPSAADVTQAGQAMGTPTYMAPEQGRDSAGVDARADVYSLGCTLYVLLTGRPPFQGASALEVLTKHATQPVIPPDAVVQQVPKELSAILLKMLAKKPAARHADMGEVIADLETFLGVRTAGPLTPNEQHVSALEAAVRQFNDAPVARLRSRVVSGFWAGIGTLVLLSSLIGWPTAAFYVLTFGLLTAVAGLVTNGLTVHSPVFSRLRELVFQAGCRDWLRGLIFGLLVLLTLWMLGLFWGTAAAVVMGVGTAVVAHFLLDRRVAGQRAATIEAAEQLLRPFRIGGVEEDAVRQFVCTYGGEGWEPLFEALFGYDAMIQARQDLGQTKARRRRLRHATWRDPLVRWIEARQQAIREAKARKHLAEVERKGLEAEGVAASEAKARAEQAAEALVHAAAAMRPRQAPRREKVSVRGMLDSARRVRVEPPPRRAGPEPMVHLARLLFGQTTRFAVGAALAVACLLWVRQNQELLNRSLTLLQSASRRQELGKDVEAFTKAQTGTKALLEGTLPAGVSGLFNSFNPGVAGLLLLISVLWRNVPIVVGAWLAAAVTLLGPLVGFSALDLPFMGMVSGQTLSLLAGLTVFVLGFVWDWVSNF